MWRRLGGCSKRRCHRARFDLARAHSRGRITPRWSRRARQSGAILSLWRAAQREPLARQTKKPLGSLASGLLRRFDALRSTWLLRARSVVRHVSVAPGVLFTVAASHGSIGAPSGHESASSGPCSRSGKPGTRGPRRGCDAHRREACACTPRASGSRSRTVISRTRGSVERFQIGRLVGGAPLGGSFAGAFHAGTPVRCRPVRPTG
jgi:hypothetical protein